MTFGIDYAGVDSNRPPNFSALKGAGASFCFIRASYAFHIPVHNAWIVQGDPTFSRDWEPLKASGLIRGAYMFPVIQAAQSATEQAEIFKHAVDAAGGLRPGIDFPPCLDIEFPGKGIDDTGLDRAGVLAWLSSVTTQLTRLFGCPPLLYTSGRVWNDTDADCLGNPPAPLSMAPCPLWLARYTYKTRLPAVLPPPEGPPPPVPGPWGDSDNYWFHQDQGDALGVPGFSSTVDISRFNSGPLHGDRARWVQRRLNVSADGSFGPQSLAALRTFQSTHGLIADGIVGPKTFCALAWA